MSKEKYDTAVKAGARAYLDRETHLRDRLGRVLDLADRWVGPGTSANDLAIRSLSRTQCDGAPATAGRVTTALRGEDSSAVDYADRPEHTGSLGRQTLSADSPLVRKQTSVRGAIRASDGAADTALACDRLIARMSPGGDIWTACRSRSAKRDIRSRVRSARRLMRSGEHRVAKAVLGR